jgi:catechol 2,3-dioxygenase-like lactoylglutathione lyase family enzyme
LTHLTHIALVVRDYDEALAFYVGKLGFELVQDTYQPAQDKRWVVICPPGPGPNATTILLARASTDHEAQYIGDQAGGRMFLFLATDDPSTGSGQASRAIRPASPPPGSNGSGSVLVSAPRCLRACAPPATIMAGSGCGGTCAATSGT